MAHFISFIFFLSENDGLLFLGGANFETNQHFPESCDTFVVVTQENVGNVGGNVEIGWKESGNSLVVGLYMAEI